jgi:plastocyanin
MPKPVLFVAPLIAFLTLGAVNAATAADAPTTQKTVEINDFNFQPKEITIAVGDTVTWINHDDVPHTATADGDSPAFDSKALDTDDKYSFTFIKSGTYPYHCKVHPHMTGTITVK